MMALAAQLFRQTEGEQRGASRMPVDLGATIRDDAARPIDATIHDLSVSGFLAETVADLTVDSLIRVGLSGLGSSMARVVWRDGGLYGCAFMRPISVHDLGLALAGQTIKRVDFGGERLAMAVAASPADGPATAEWREVRGGGAAEKWPARQRLMFIVGASVALWAVIGIGAAAFLS